MTASAQGIDISSFQSVYSVAQLERYEFAIFRATLGTTESDPNFAANWANAKTAKIHRGAYHELTNLSPESTQAEHFIATVKARGVQPGDMLACVATDYPVSSASVKAFCVAVQKEFPQSPVLIYSDQSELENWSAEAAQFELWLAWYRSTPPASVAPWKTWRLWQWSDSPVDQDAFNGTKASLDAWIASHVKPAPRPAPKPSPSADLWPAGVTLKPGSTGSAVRALQRALNYNDARGSRGLKVDGEDGPETTRAVRSFEKRYNLPDSKLGNGEWDGIAGREVRSKLVALGHLTAEGVPAA